MTIQELTLEERFRFLTRVYFGDINDLYNVVGNRAFRDFSITIKYNNDVSYQVKEQKKSEINKMIGEGLVGIKKEEFDLWHKNLCEKIVDVFKPLVHSFNYGQAQKWVNMMAKYLLTIKYDEFKHLIPVLHIPIDNYVLDLAVKEFGISKPKKKWSQWNEYQYIKYQNTLKDRITEESPIIWEYRNWGNYISMERTSKGLSKKNNKPIKNQTLGRESNLCEKLLPLKNERKHDELIKGEWVTLNGEPFRLFVAKREGKGHFCQLCYKYEENRQKSGVFDIGKVQDIQRLFNEFNNVKWHTGGNKTWAYVMYEGNDAEEKAKALYNKILLFVKGLSK